MGGGIYPVRRDEFRVLFLWGYLTGKKSLENIELGGKIILKQVLKEQGGEVGLDLSVTGCGQVTSSCDRDNEPLDFITMPGTCWLSENMLTS